MSTEPTGCVRATSVRWSKSKSLMIGQGAKFPSGTYKVKAISLNISDIQQNSFWHCVTDVYVFESIGQVKDLEEVRLIVEIRVSEVKLKPKTSKPRPMSSG